MRNRRFVKVMGVVCGLSLLAAACGGDDNAADPTTTEESGDTTTTEGGDGGELVGAKGTTPAPSAYSCIRSWNAVTASVVSGAGIELDDTFAYGPESYDGAIIIALAAQSAGDDGAARAMMMAPS